MKTPKTLSRVSETYYALTVRDCGKLASKEDINHATFYYNDKESAYEIAETIGNFYVYKCEAIEVYDTETKKTSIEFKAKLKAAFWD